MWVLVAFSAVIILVGLIPIRFTIEYSGNGFSVCMNVLALRFEFPREMRKRTSRKKNEGKIQGKKPGSLKNFRMAIGPILNTLGKLIRTICVRRLVANVTLASDDAFSTAMMYGGAAAGIGAVFPAVDRNLKIKKKYISVNADFESSETMVYLLADITILIWQVIMLAICFLYQYFKKLSSIKKKGLEENG